MTFEKSKREEERERESYSKNSRSRVSSSLTFSFEPLLFAITFMDFLAPKLVFELVSLLLVFELLLSTLLITTLDDDSFYLVNSVSYRYLRGRQ